MTYISSGFATALDYHEQGLLDDEMIETYGQGFLQVFDSPVVMEWWERLPTTPAPPLPVHPAQEHVPPEPGTCPIPQAKNFPDKMGVCLMTT